MSGNSWWQNAISHPHASYSLTALTKVTVKEIIFFRSRFFQYAVPEAETFNLLGEGEEGEKSVKEKEKKKAVDRSKAVTHLRSRILLSTMTEQVAIFLSASSH